MGEIRQLVAYDDIVVGEDFNSRESFRTFVQKAFTTAEDGKSTLKGAAELKKTLDLPETRILEQLQELAASIDSQGLLQPLLVREGSASKKKGRRSYFLIAGERRYRAIGLLRENTNKFKQIEVKLKKCNVEDALLCNAYENLQRADLTPLEIANLIQKIMVLGKLTQSQAAKRIGKSEPFVSQHLGLLRTAPEVQEALVAGDLTATHVREMLTLPAAKQKEILATVVERTDKGQKVSVLDVKEEADKAKKALGIKRTKVHKAKNDEPEYDVAKVKAAKELLGDHEVHLRSVKASLELFAILHARISNPQSSEATVQKTKAQLAVVEWQLGVRETV